MFRLCVLALVAVTLLLVTNTALKADTMVDDVGCVDGGAYWNYQMVHRIIIWDDNGLSYMEEVPCGSGKWHERGRVAGPPPTVLINPGVFTSTGTIEFHIAPNLAGIITEGTGPYDRRFVAAPSTTMLIISVPVVQSLVRTLTDIQTYN
jgi:hypothetical protein